MPRNRKKHDGKVENSNFLDDQYFGDIDSQLPQDRVLEDSPHLSPQSYDNDLNFVDSQYFGSRENSPPTSVKVTTKDLTFDESDNYVDRMHFGSQDQSNHVCTPSPFPSKSSRQFPIYGKEVKHSAAKADRSESPNSVFRVADVLREVRSKTRMNLWSGTVLDLPHPETERRDQERRDSYGSRVPDDDSIKFDFLTEDEAAQVLFKSIIDIRDNIIVLNKPYGISSQPGPAHNYSVSQLLPRLEHRIRKSGDASTTPASEAEQYFIAHRLDRECTGLMLIARNRDTCLKLQEAFVRRLILKDYLCITSGIPKNPRGCVQLPLVERKFGGVYKMCIAPLNRRVQRAQLDVATENQSNDCEETLISEIPATSYQVLDSKHYAALLLCSTRSGSKHQVRVHLSMGLGTPILGDHKYSHATHLTPQRLHPRLLERLQIRQPKVRHLLLHLHAARLQFIQNDDCDDNFFSFLDSKHSVSHHSLPRFIAPPPNFFLQNLHRIGLRLPSHLSRVCIK